MNNDFSEFIQSPNMSKELIEILKQGNFTLYNPKNNLQVTILPDQFKSVGQLCEFCFAKLSESDQADYTKNSRSIIKKFSSLLRNADGRKNVKGWCLDPENRGFSKKPETDQFDANILRDALILENPSYKIDRFVIPAGSCKTLDDLFLALIKKSNFPLEDFLQNKNKYKQDFRKYYKNIRVTSFFDGWLIKDFVPDTVQMNLYILQKKNLLLYNDRDPNNILKLQIGAGSFQSISSLVKHAVSFLEQEKKHYENFSKAYNNGFSKLLTNFEKSPGSYRNWTIYDNDKNVDNIIDLKLQNSLLSKEENQKVNKFYVSNNINLPNISESILNFFTLWIEKYTNENYIKLWFDYFPNNCFYIIGMSEDQKSEEIALFKQIRFFSDMNSFLENSVSLYHRLCHFFLIYPVENYLVNNNYFHRFQSHHIFPAYMEKRFKENFSNINESYNLIRVPYLIHTILHLIRFAEFLYSSDFPFLSTINKISPFDNQKQKPEGDNQIRNVFEQCLNIVIQRTSQELKPEEFRDLARDYQVRTLRSDIKEILSKEMTWVNMDFPEITPVNFEANEFELVRDLAEYLWLELQYYFSLNPKIEKKRNYDVNRYARRSYFHAYLSKQRPSFPFGWKLIGHENI